MIKLQNLFGPKPDEDGEKNTFFIWHVGYQIRVKKGMESLF